MTQFGPFIEGLIIVALGILMAVLDKMIGTSFGNESTILITAGLSYAVGAKAANPAPPVQGLAARTLINAVDEPPAVGYKAADPPPPAAH